MNLTLRVWRQADARSKGKMAIYKVNDVSEHMSFLEMLDVLNERLTLQGDDPIAFDSDCREGICGMCGLVINGVAHGPQQTTTCQLHMRSFSDGDVIDIEPWRADAVPGDQGPGGRSQRIRSDHPGRRLHLRADRHRSRCARHAGAQTGRRPCVRRGDLHRLWCLRRRLPQRLGDAVHRREDHPSRPAAARPARALLPGGRHGGPARCGGIRRLHQHR